MTTIAQTPLKYRGQNTQYVDIAVRGTDEHLGLGIDYAVHPSGVGCFIVRFVAHGADAKPQNFKHLMYRESAKYVSAASEGKMAELFKGLRLNKMAVKVFVPPILQHEIDKFATKFGVWETLTAWITQQVTTEGFTVTVDLAQEIRNLLVSVSTPEDSVKCVIAFPDLASDKEQAIAFSQVQKPEADEEEDGDEDENGGDKPWMN